MIYGYCRISRRTMNIERQVRNIKAEYPEAVIIKEAYTGRSMARPAWQKLYNKVESGSTIVFDSVSRMSRTAEEGFKAYEDLFNRGVNLVFLKEPHINTAVYKNAINNTVKLTGGNKAKEIIKKHSNIFGGELNDLQCMKLAGVSNATFYKYRKELEDELESGANND